MAAPRSEREALDDLRGPRASPGQLHALAPVALRDDVVAASHGDERTVRTECATLLGLLPKGRVDFARPPSKHLRATVERTHALLDPGGPRTRGGPTRTRTPVDALASGERGRRRPPPRGVARSPGPMRPHVPPPTSIDFSNIIQYILGMTMTRDHLSAARVLLHLPQDALAELCSVGLATVGRLETESGMLGCSLDKIRGALEAASHARTVADEGREGELIREEGRLLEAEEGPPGARGSGRRLRPAVVVSP